MKITRLYSGQDDESHFEDQYIPLKDNGDIGKLSKLFDATGIQCRVTSGDYDYDWHNAPCRQIVIMLDGEVEITVGSGEIRRFVTGDILLAEDTTGRGHISRSINQQPRKSIFVIL